MKASPLAPWMLPPPRGVMILAEAVIGTAPDSRQNFTTPVCAVEPKEVTAVEPEMTTICSRTEPSSTVDPDAIVALPVINGWLVEPRWKNTQCTTEEA